METAILRQDKYVVMFGYHRAMLQVAKGVIKITKPRCGNQGVTKKNVRG